MASLRLPGGLNAAVSLSDKSATTGQSLGITINSFLQPDNRSDPTTRGSNVAIVNAELNAWHQNDQGSPLCRTAGEACRHWIGRGSPPGGWIGLSESAYVTTVDSAAPPNTFWPYDPRVLSSQGAALAEGDYARMSGTLWQDNDHTVVRWTNLRPGLGAWLEIHPPDWIVRIPRPGTARSPRVVELINWDPAIDVAETRTLTPTDPQPGGAALRCRELVDGRFTWPSSVVQHSTTVGGADVTVQTTVRRAVPDARFPGTTAVQPGRFKATYLLWWEAGSGPETTCRQG
jgi:hypothetical protein